MVCRNPDRKDGTRFPLPVRSSSSSSFGNIILLLLAVAAVLILEP